jgi:tetratricopeptide (TPR) repeat protein
MSSRLTRKELKTDEVREGFYRVLVAVQVHWRRLSIGAAAVAVVAFVVVGMLVVRAARETRAQVALVDALAVSGAPIDPIAATPSDPKAPSFATESDRTREARQRLEALIESHPGSSAAQVARSYVAGMKATDGGLAEAREIWQSLAGRGGDTLAATAEINLIRLDRQEGQLEDLADRIETRIESQDSSLPSDLLLFELALTLQELERDDDARDAFQRLVDEHPRSPLWAQAQDKLSSAT